MFPTHRFQRARPPRGRGFPALLVLSVCSALIFPLRRAGAAANVVVSDTVSKLGGPLDLESRAGWKTVPADLLALEANPDKARSDPGYYGREYSLKGDVVVENHGVTAVFWSAKGRVVLFSKSVFAPGGLASISGPAIQFAEIAALGATSEGARISQLRILRNADDQAVVEASFSAPGGAGRSATFSFDKTGILEIKPGAEMKGVRLLCPIAYAVAPSFVADDLVFAAADYPSARSLCVSSENVLLGLLEGGDGVLTMTWPEGKQRLNLALGENAAGARRIESVDFENDGKSLFLAVSRARGLWRREVLKPSYLEKNATSEWEKPFPAKWKTQLDEGGARTTFAFRDSPLEIWRGVLGSYAYPVWFDGDRAVFHLSKKIPPKGDALVYFVEGNQTPAAVSTPVDVMKATLGRELCDNLLDPAGRSLRTHHRRGDDGVHRACTCGCTEAIEAVFAAGEEVERKDYISGAVDDMIYFIQRHLARIDEYRRFADETTALLNAKEGSSPALKTYLENLAGIAGQIPQEYTVQLENMKSLSYAAELSRRTLALAGKKNPKNVAAYKELLEAWRAMGGAQDFVVAQCHIITRKLYQEAGYGCVNLPEAVELARALRERCRQCLRNPDGYEIWPDY